MIFYKIFNDSRIQVFLIIFLAILFRLTFLDQIEFKYDEALVTFQTFLFYLAPNLPQTGLIASTGMYNFPLFNYLLILIGLFSRNPLYLSFVIALINVGLILLFYILNKKLFGKGVAFISAITLAISPWAIIFSRKIWAQDFILLFAIPFYYIFIKILETKKPQNLIILAFLLFLLIQLHASGLFLIVTVIAIFILHKVKVNKKEILKGVLLASIFALPFIIFEISTTPFCRDCAAFFEYQKLARIFDFENFLRPFQILNGLHFEFLLGNDYSEFLKFNQFLNPIKYIFIVEIIIFIISFLCFLKKDRSKLYLAIILFLIPFLYFITRTPSYIHYYVIILPIVCLAYGLTFKYFYTIKKNNLYRAFIITIFLIFFLSKIIFIHSFFQFLTIKQAFSGDYGPSFKLSEKLVNQNLINYSSLNYFEEIKQYASIFINTSVFHQRMGVFFLEKQKLDLAQVEFQKALETNNKDLYSRANLAYIYIQIGKKTNASEQIDIIEKEDLSLSQELRQLLK